MVVPPGGSKRLLDLDEPAPTRVTRQKAKAGSQPSPLHKDHGSSLQVDDGFVSTDEGSTVHMELALSPVAPTVERNGPADSTDIFGEHEEPMGDADIYAEREDPMGDEGKSI